MSLRRRNVTSPACCKAAERCLHDGRQSSTDQFLYPYHELFPPEAPGNLSFLLVLELFSSEIHHVGVTLHYF